MATVNVSLKSSQGRISINKDQQLSDRIRSVSSGASLGAYFNVVADWEKEGVSKTQEAEQKAPSQHVKCNNSL